MLPISLMKGDEVVETGEDTANCPLFGNAWIGDINLLEILVVEMDHGLSLSTFRHLVVGACAGDCKREESLVELVVRTDDIEISAK